MNKRSVSHFVTVRERRSRPWKRDSPREGRGKTTKRENGRRQGK